MSTRYLSDAELARALATRDLTDPAEGRHALQLLVDDVSRALARHWRCGSRLCRGTRVVALEDNYDALGYSPDAVTREARYTRYTGDRTVLRSHTSAIVSPALRVLAAVEASGRAVPDDLLLVCPGIVYRRDAIDRLHTGTPHQLDLWRIRRGRDSLQPGDLKEMIDVVVRALVPGADHRVEPRIHPYTTNGLQVDVDDGGEWIEIGECGLAAPAVLARAGLDPSEWSGLAMGIGLDRALMLRKGMHDIRLLRSQDPRVARQMTHLGLYRPVSSHRPIVRDCSVAVAGDDDAEGLGDRVRDALGADADAVEAVEVLSETPGDALPPAAIERLGLRPGQKNLLVRVVLRHPSRTLTREEANDLRDRVYAALHQGSPPSR